MIRMAPGWHWVLWGLGAGVSGLPLLMTWLHEGRLSWWGVMGSVLVSGILTALVGIVAVLSRVRDLSLALRWDVLVLGAMLLASYGFHPLRRGCGRSSAGSACTNHLKQIGTAMALYCDAHGRCPGDPGSQSLPALVSAGLLHEDALVCRLARGRGGLSYAVNPALAGKASPEAGIPDPSRVPWVYDREALHGKDGERWRCVLFLDQHVERVKQADLEALLKGRAGR